MKIAVVAIALNEEKFVQRWAQSGKDADYIILGDTGSSDLTVSRFWEMHNIWEGSVDSHPKMIVHNLVVSPWRFDVARNALHSLIPADVDFVINLDMDEVLVDGWREKLEAVELGVTRPRYTYTWSWNPDGTPDLQYKGDKITARNGYHWKHPVHEVLKPYAEEVHGDIELEIHHYPDGSKPRSYLPLLELAMREDPNDERNAFYYARELFYAGRKQEAVKAFRYHISIATWAPEISQSWRFIAKCQDSLEHKSTSLIKAIEAAPGRREACVDMAVLCYSNNHWKLCLNFAIMALMVRKKPLDYICEAFAWGYLPYDMAAIASFRLGQYSEAVKYGEMALEIEPWDERLKQNLDFYYEAVQ